MCCSFFFYYCIMCSQQKLLLKRNINYKDLVSLSRINIMINPNIHTYCYSRVRIQKIFSFSLLFYQGSLLISSRPNQGHSCVYFKLYICYPKQGNIRIIPALSSPTIAPNTYSSSVSLKDLW